MQNSTGNRALACRGYEFGLVSQHTGPKRPDMSPKYSKLFLTRLSHLLKQRACCECLPQMARQPPISPTLQAFLLTNPCICISCNKERLPCTTSQPQVSPLQHPRTWGCRPGTPDHHTHGRAAVPCAPGCHRSTPAPSSLPAECRPSSTQTLPALGSTGTAARCWGWSHPSAACLVGEETGRGDSKGAQEDTSVKVD